MAYVPLLINAFQHKILWKNIRLVFEFKIICSHFSNTITIHDQGNMSGIFWPNCSPYVIGLLNLLSASLIGALIKIDKESFLRILIVLDLFFNDVLLTLYFKYKFHNFKTL